MPGEISRSYEGPMGADDVPEEEPVLAIQCDAQFLGKYSREVLEREVHRLRSLLDDCWDATGMLGAQVTGQPWQAWDAQGDLVPQIEDLRSDAQEYRDNLELEDEQE